jgi:hypothetical protein
MNGKTALALMIAFAASVLALGIPYWAMPYSEISVPDSLMGIGLIVVVTAACLLRLLRVAGLLAASVVAGAAAPCVVMARVAWDTASDPTSHNLWPIEVAFAAFTGLAAAGIGAAIGSLLAALLAAPKTP